MRGNSQSYFFPSFLTSFIFADSIGCFFLISSLQHNKGPPWQSTGDHVKCKVMICDELQCWILHHKNIFIFNICVHLTVASGDSSVLYASDPSLQGSWLVRPTAWKPMWRWSSGDRQLPAGKSHRGGKMWCWRNIHQGPDWRMQSEPYAWSQYECKSWELEKAADNVSVISNGQ